MDSVFLHSAKEYQKCTYSAPKIAENTNVVKQLFLPCGTVNYCMNYHSKE